MLANRIARACSSLTCRRLISGSTKRLDSKIPDAGAKASSSPSSSNPSVNIVREIEPTGLDKFILVWVKKYPKGQVPNRIKESEIAQAKSKARIKTANYMMAITLLCCAYLAYTTRQAAKQGDSIFKRNIEWHQQINEEHKAKLKAESSQ